MWPKTTSVTAASRMQMTVAVLLSVFLSAMAAELVYWFNVTLSFEVLELATDSNWNEDGLKAVLFVATLTK